MKRKSSQRKVGQMERDLHGAISGLSGAVTALTTSHNELREIVIGEPGKPFSFGVVRLVKAGLGLLGTVVSIGLASLWMQYKTIQRATFSAQQALVSSQIAAEVKETVKAVADKVDGNEVLRRSAQTTAERSAKSKR